jgi:hypothetical protein
MKKGKGYYYEVSAEQVAEHKKRTLLEIFTWISQTNAFLNKVRKPEEKAFAEKLRSGEI